MNRHCLGTMLAVITLSAAHAAVPSRKPAPPPVAPQHHGVMAILAKTMAGQRVMCVGTSLGGYNAKVDPAALTSARTLAEKAKFIAKAASEDGEKVLAFPVGNAWVIAPAKREEVDPGVPMTLTNVMGPGARLNVVLADIAPDHIAALGSDNGLAVSDLSPEAQQMLESILKPPLRILTLYKSNAPTVTLNEPLDWTTTRIRARLHLDGAWVPIGHKSNQALSGDDRQVASLFPASGGQDESGVTIPFLQEIPNGFRPSDLEGKGYNQPIGVSGVVPMSALLKRLSAVTGLRLVSSNDFEDVPVFLGSKSITAGEAMDGLRLGTTGAFRHIGNSYILAWDRWGLGAIQQYIFESRSLPVAEQAKQKIEAANTSSNLATMARDLPFDPADPLALTEQQQARLFDTTDNPAFTAPIPSYNTREEAEAAPPSPRYLSIPFSDMTQGQRDYIVQEAKTEKIYTQSPDAAEPASRPMTDADIAGAKLTNSVNITLSVSIPGSGWVPLHNSGFQYGRFSGGDLPAPGRTAKGDIAAPDTGAPAPTPPLPSQPVSIPAAKRGAVLPILGPGHVTELAKDLKRHGFNLVFYPALDGGYATFPNTSFPTARILRERDGLADAVAAMSAQGIEVVPYISVLGWQRPGDTPHWLDKHPDWLDRDILERTRLEYAEDLPVWPSDPVMHVLGCLNFVRPQEPAVVSKLTAFVADLARQPGTSGVAFLDWEAPVRAPRSYEPKEPPALGHGMPERTAAFKATGEDPVDAPLFPTSPSTPFRPKVFNILDIPQTPRKAVTPPADPSAALLGKLLKEAKADRPGWKTYAVSGGPAADVMLNVARGLIPSGQEGPFVPLWPQGSGMEGWPSEIQQMPAIAPVTMGLAQPDATAQMSLAVLDFRAIPDEIEDSLRWISGGP